MANLDRSHVVELLGRLGAADDQTVLEAARAAHCAVSEAGLSWDDLVGAETAGESVEEVEAESDTASAETGGDGADNAEALRLVTRLLAKKDISDNLREELTEMRRALAEGEFDAMDANYIRALAKRLGV